jgi:hypothetical protein
MAGGECGLLIQASDRFFEIPLDEGLAASVAEFQEPLSRHLVRS